MPTSPADIYDSGSERLRDFFQPLLDKDATNEVAQPPRAASGVVLFRLPCGVMHVAALWCDACRCVVVSRSVMLLS